MDWWTSICHNTPPRRNSGVTGSRSLYPTLICEDSAKQRQAEAAKNKQPFYDEQDQEPSRSAEPPGPEDREQDLELGEQDIHRLEEQILDLDQCGENGFKLVHRDNIRPEPSWRCKNLSCLSRTRQGPRYSGASLCTKTYLADIRAAGSG